MAKRLPEFSLRRAQIRAEEILGCKITREWLKRGIHMKDKEGNQRYFNVLIVKPSHFYWTDDKDGNTKRVLVKPSIQAREDTFEEDLLRYAKDYPPRDRRKFPAGPNHRMDVVKQDSDLW